MRKIMLLHQQLTSGIAQYVRSKMRLSTVNVRCAEWVNNQFIGTRLSTKTDNDMSITNDCWETTARVDSKRETGMAMMRVFLANVTKPLFFSVVESACAGCASSTELSYK